MILWGFLWVCYASVKFAPDVWWVVNSCSGPRCKASCSITVSYWEPLEIAFALHQTRNPLHLPLQAPECPAEVTRSALTRSQWSGVGCRPGMTLKQLLGGLPIRLCSTTGSITLWPTMEVKVGCSTKMSVNLWFNIFLTPQDRREGNLNTWTEIIGKIKEACVLCLLSKFPEA